MLYSEFVEGTGCKENMHNFKVYEDLEVMYDNSNLTKEQIYEYGKKLVDNDIKECRYHLLPWLVVCDIPGNAASYVAAAFMIKDAAETYVEHFRKIGDYRVVHKSDLYNEYTVIEDRDASN